MNSKNSKNRLTLGEKKKIAWALGLVMSASSQEIQQALETKKKDGEEKKLSNNSFEEIENSYKENLSSIEEKLQRQEIFLNSEEDEDLKDDIRVSIEKTKTEKNTLEEEFSQQKKNFEENNIDLNEITELVDQHTLYKQAQKKYLKSQYVWKIINRDKTQQAIEKHTKEEIAAENKDFEEQKKRFEETLSVEKNTRMAELAAELEQRKEKKALFSDNEKIAEKCDQKIKEIEDVIEGKSKEVNEENDVKLQEITENHKKNISILQNVWENVNKKPLIERFEYAIFSQDWKEKEASMELIKETTKNIWYDKEKYLDLAKKVELNNKCREEVIDRKYWLKEWPAGLKEQIKDIVNLFDNGIMNNREYYRVLNPEGEEISKFFWGLKDMIPDYIWLRLPRILNKLPVLKKLHYEKINQIKEKREKKEDISTDLREVREIILEDEKTEKYKEPPRIEDNFPFIDKQLEFKDSDEIEKIIKEYADYQIELDSIKEEKKSLSVAKKYTDHLVYVEKIELNTKSSMKEFSSIWEINESSADHMRDQDIEIYKEYRENQIRRLEKDQKDDQNQRERAKEQEKEHNKTLRKFSKDRKETDKKIKEEIAKYEWLLAEKEKKISDIKKQIIEFNESCNLEFYNNFKKEAKKEFIKENKEEITRIYKSYLQYVLPKTKEVFDVENDLLDDVNWEKIENDTDLQAIKQKVKDFVQWLEEKVSLYEKFLIDKTDQKKGELEKIKKELQTIWDLWKR